MRHYASRPGWLGPARLRAYQGGLGTREVVSAMVNISCEVQSPPAGGRGCGGPRVGRARSRPPRAGGRSRDRVLMGAYRGPTAPRGGVALGTWEWVFLGPKDINLPARFIR